MPRRLISACSSVGPVGVFEVGGDDGGGDVVPLLQVGGVGFHGGGVAGGEDDVVAGGGEVFGERFADAGGGAGDEGGARVGGHGSVALSVASMVVVWEWRSVILDVMMTG